MFNCINTRFAQSGAAQTTILKVLFGKIGYTPFLLPVHDTYSHQMYVEVYDGVVVMLCALH